MIKKYGYTLVELLAVIAILGILAIITLPNIVEMFKEAKKDTFATEARTIIKMANQQYVLDTLTSSGEIVYSKCADHCNNNLQLTARQQLEYYIKLNASGNIEECYITDGTYQYQYEGESLDEANIDVDTEIREVAMLPAKDIISISYDGPNFEGAFVDVCVYTDDYYNSQVVNCKKNTTLSLCLASLGLYEKYFYYSDRFSNCTKNVRRYYCGSVLDFNSGRAINNCYSNYASIQEISSFDKVSKYVDSITNTFKGCVSVTKRTTVRYCCLDGESEVEVYDKKKKKRVRKKLKDVTYDDLILCWDFDEGKYVYQKPVWIMKEKRIDESLVLTFSDGSKLKIAADHRIYNMDSQMFTSCKSDEQTPIGMRTINSKGEIITLVSKEVVKEKITACNVVTYKDINIYANGILTSRGSNNLYKIDNMKFVKDNRETLNRDDFADVSNDLYYGLRLGERDISIYGSRENALYELNEFVKEIEDSMKD